MTLAIGTKVRSLRNRQEGTVVGYGSLVWPWPYKKDTTSGDKQMQAVYLVQIAVASSCLGPACAVFRADMIQEVKD